MNLIGVEEILMAIVSGLSVAAIVFALAIALSIFGEDKS